MNNRFDSTASSSKRLRSSRFGMCALGIASLIALTSANWAPGQEEKPEAAAVGLQGILPSESPTGLSYEDFSDIHKNWEAWSEKTAGMVAGLYENEDLDVAAQRAVITNLNTQLAIMSEAIADPRYVAIHARLRSLSSRLQRRLDVASAILDTLDIDPKVARRETIAKAKQAVTTANAAVGKYLDSKQGKGAGWKVFVRVDDLAAWSAGDGADQEVLKSVSKRLAGKDMLAAAQRKFLEKPEFAKLESTINGYLAASDKEPPNAASAQKLREALAAMTKSLELHEATGSKEAAFAARDAYRAVIDFAPDGAARLGSALQQHYFNYNLQVVASEAFLDRLMKENRNDNGPVNDYILGARVSGSQSTETTTGIDLKPSTTEARFNITLKGVTHSQTRGVTSQATIFTSGYHQFWAQKPLTYDGKKLSAEQAEIQVNANNTTTGADTALPIFGESIAMNAARKKRGQSEAIARSRIRDRVVPEMDKEVDKFVATTNQDLEKKLYGKLKETGLYPSASLFRTNESFLRISSRISGSEEVGGGLAPSVKTPGTGVSIQIHESLVNNAIDKMALRGEELTGDRVIEEFEESLSDLLGKKVSLKTMKSAAKDEEDNEPPVKYAFDKNDPIRFKFDDGEVRVSIKSAFKQEGKEDIPTQTITIPLGLAVSGKNIQLTRGSVRVAGSSLNIARTAVIRKKLESAIEDRLIDGVITVPADEKKGKQELNLLITSISVTDGWITITLQ
ncbi:MAG: hypothetical protein O3A00_02905 [Planctomycetota bacterium]|nr:hypothetical protein [Planctomycetota bacterium]